MMSVKMGIYCEPRVIRTYGIYPKIALFVLYFVMGQTNKLQRQIKENQIFNLSYNFFIKNSYRNMPLKILKIYNFVDNNKMEVTVSNYFFYDLLMVLILKKEDLFYVFKFTFFI